MMEAPIDGKVYLITGDDCFGEWTAKATCKYYKSGGKYRWVMRDGSIEQSKHITKFELVNK